MRQGAEAGFSLVEVLVALTIFAIGLLALAGMQITAIKTNSSANVRTVQTDIAASVLEELVNMSAIDLAALDNGALHDWEFEPGVVTVTVPSGGTYEAEYLVRVDNPISKLIRIDLDVTQTNGLERTYSVTGFKSAL